MSNLSFYLMIFGILMLIGGWVSAEIISSRTSKNNKKYVKHLSLLDKENTRLQNALSEESDRYAHVKEEYDKLRDAKVQIRTLEQEYKRLTMQFNRSSDGIDTLRQKVTSKKYSSNSLAKEIELLLDERFPSEEQRAALKAEGTKDTFKRIKNAMGMGGAER